MKFTVIYQNQDHIRQMVCQTLLQAIGQGIDLEQKPISTPFFSTRKRWPDIQELMNIPLSHQCEEYKYDGKQLNSIRLLIMDAEIIESKVEQTKAPSAEEIKADFEQLQFDF